MYLIRLIHHQTRRPSPENDCGRPISWPSPATIRFLRARNCEGCDVYIQPFADHQNAGYILLDLDCANPMVLEIMRAHGHDPCVVLQTSPGHWQACIHQPQADPTHTQRLAPWVKLVYARAGLAPRADTLLLSAAALAQPSSPSVQPVHSVLPTVAEPARNPSTEPRPPPSTRVVW